jgi:two-component system osmolarity sensor histidine kinase EnvZ
MKCNGQSTRGCCRRAISSVPSTDAAFAASAEGYLDTIDTTLQQLMDYAGAGPKETPVVGDML